MPSDSELASDSVCVSSKKSRPVFSEKGLRAYHLIEGDLRGAGLEFEAARPIERIRDNRASAALGLTEEDGLIDERGLTVDGADILGDPAAEIGHLAADQSPVHPVRLIQIHGLDRRIPAAETAANALIQLYRCAEAVEIGRAHV